MPSIIKIVVITFLAISAGLPSHGQIQWPDSRLRVPVYLQNGIQLPQDPLAGNSPQVISQNPVYNQAGYPDNQQRAQGPITTYGGPVPYLQYQPPVTQVPVTIHGGTGTKDCGACPPGQTRQPSYGPYCGQCINDVSSCSQGYYLEGTSCIKCPCPDNDAMGIRCKGCHKDPNGRVVCDCNPNYSGSTCQNCAPGCIQRDNFPYDCFKPNSTVTCTGSGCNGWTGGVTGTQINTVGQVVSSCRGTRCGQQGSSCPGGDCQQAGSSCVGPQCRMPTNLCPGCNCQGVGCPCDTCNFNQYHFSTAIVLNQTCSPCYHQHQHCPPCNSNCRTCNQPGNCQPCGQPNPCQCPPPCPSCCNQCGGCPPITCPTPRPPTPEPPTWPPITTTTLRPTPPTTCDNCCDPRGTYASGTGYNRYDCTCKANVMGGYCGTCKPGYFGLSSSNPLGCSACFCSGFSTQCSEATFYRTYITLNQAVPGLTLLNLNTGAKIEQYIFNVNGQVTYSFNDASSRQGTLYWVLPADFIGGRLTSYGGVISAVRSFTNTVGGQSNHGNDIIIRGTYGHYIYWSSPEVIRSGYEGQIAAKLEEGAGWLSAHNGYAQPATRRDIMLVLADIQTILMRATIANPSSIQTTSIRNVTMANAVTDRVLGVLPSTELTTGIEQCVCPIGYQGWSCESCSPGYYRDYTDTSSGVFGACRRCPCGIHSKGCSLENGQITCHCKEGYTGPDCRGCASLTMSLDPMDCRDCFDALLRYTCSYIGTGTLDNLEIEFSTIPEWSYLVSTDPAASQAGVIFPGSQQGKSRTISVPLLRNLRRVVCQIKNTANDVLIEAKSIVVGEDCTPPGPPIPPPHVGLTLSSEFVCIYANESTVVTCNSNYDPNAPIYWTREGFGTLPVAVQADRNTLRIINPQVEDSGTYVCVSSGGIIPGIYTKKLVIKIKSCTTQQPGGGGGTRIDWGGMYGDGGIGNNSTSSGIPVAFVNVQTPLKIVAGEKAHLTCDAAGKPTPVVTFSRSVDGQETTLRKSDHAGVSYDIQNATVNDQGTYLCTAENSLGKDTTVLEVTILQDNTTQGESTKCKDTEFKCKNNECIPNSKKCDGVKDCTDGSDEKGKVCNKISKSKQTQN